MKNSSPNFRPEARLDIGAALATLSPDLSHRVRSDATLLHAANTIWEDSNTNVQKFGCRIKRFLAGEQLEYVLGYQTFDGHRFRADRRAYIAQDDSLHFLATLAEEARVLSRRVGRPLRICEIGVGGGALLAAFLMRCRDSVPECRIAQAWGLDIDAAALEVAAENCAGLGPPVALVESDVLCALPDDAAPDLIFAYPPWGDRHADDADFAGSDWEVFHRALPQISCYTVGGETSVHRAILSQAHARFPRAGLFVFNDVLPQSEIALLTADHPWIEAEACGPDMTLLVRRG